MLIRPNNDPNDVFDKHYAVKCPHCGILSNISAIAIPRYEYLLRFRTEKVGVAYCCDNCKFPVFLRFNVEAYEPGNNKIIINDNPEEVEKSQETFEYKYLPQEVAEDLREALVSYSNACYQAFAAMCRRCIQTAFMELGAAGKDKVIQQLKEVKITANLDDETYELLEQVIVSGHDGAHPHLPKLSPSRAGILLELIKDVLYQLFVRQAKIQEAINARRQDINENKNKPT